jgi:hypothetical protein
MLIPFAVAARATAAATFLLAPTGAAVAQDTITLRPTPITPTATECLTAMREGVRLTGDASGWLLFLWHDTLYIIDVQIAYIDCTAQTYQQEQ